MKLEVGMYVRTETGQIGKITNFDDSMARVDTDKFITYKNFNSEITKASHSIIDLVQVEDYVNGYKVVDIINYNRKLEPSTMIYCEYGSRYIGFYNEEIKSVITHEQMEQMEYSVEE